MKLEFQIHTLGVLAMTYFGIFTKRGSEVKT
jgi:hypothetical protein